MWNDTVVIQSFEIMDFNEDSYTVRLEGDKKFFTFNEITSSLTMDAASAKQEVSEPTTFEVKIIITDSKGYSSKYLFVIKVKPKIISVTSKQEKNGEEEDKGIDDSIEEGPRM